jgi:Leucine-rich repeat (LRR) protein
MFSASMRQNLEYLDFSVNEIETIDEGAFVGMIQLEHLHLSNNKITDVSVLFVSFPKLISLDLSYNEITSIESMQNLNAPELMRLDFSNNALIEVVGSELVSLDNNTQLNFEANSITTVDLAGVWIKTMSFEKNQISVVKSLPGCDRYVVVCFVIEY